MFVPEDVFVFASSIRSYIHSACQKSIRLGLCENFRFQGIASPVDSYRYAFFRYQYSCIGSTALAIIVKFYRVRAVQNDRNELNYDFSSWRFPTVRDVCASKNLTVLFHELRIDTCSSEYFQPSALVDMKSLYRDAHKNYVDDDSGGNKYSHPDFANSRAWTRFSGWAWCIGSWIGHLGWVWMLGRGIHDRQPRKIIFALLILPVSVFATAHGAGLLLGL
jgi:hypothetical protein